MKKALAGILAVLFFVSILVSCTNTGQHPPVDNKSKNTVTTDAPAATPEHKKSPSDSSDFSLSWPELYEIPGKE